MRKKKKKGYKFSKLFCIFFFPFNKMFTRIFNSLRENIAKSNHRQPTTKHEDPSSPLSDMSSERRPSVTEECDSVLSKFTTQTAPVPIKNNGRRRSSTVFGISNVTFDDYVQKDLVSSSWS